MRRILLLVLVVVVGAWVLRVIMERREPEAAPQSASWPPLRPTEQQPQSWVEPTDGQCPVSHPIKAKASSGIYHVAGGLAYERTNADRCYATPEAAESDGYRAAAR